jgi:hypothetical protein
MQDQKSLGTGISDFARAMFTGWFSRMSGPLSVPAAALALWVDNESAKILLGVTAFVCLWATAFLVWRKEREAVVKLAGLEVGRLEFVKLIAARGGVGYDLEIMNSGGDHLNNCIVKIEKVGVTSGTPIKSSVFPIVLVPKSQIGKATDGAFSLRAGEREALSFVYQANMPSRWMSLDYGVARMIIFHDVRKCYLDLVAYGARRPVAAKVTAELDAENRLGARLIDVK